MVVVALGGAGELVWLELFIDERVHDPFEVLVVSNTLGEELLARVIDVAGVRLVGPVLIFVPPIRVVGFECVGQGLLC